MTEHCRLITEEQYKEWKACEKKLDITVKALKKIAWHYKPEYNKAGEIAHSALKQIKEEK